MNKDSRYYLNLKYPLIIREGEENGEKVYSLEIPDLPGCGAEGKTLEEAKEKLEEAKKLWIEESLTRSLPIPEPGEEEYSGRILLRIPPFLHGQLRKRARQAGVSLNKYISAALESGATLSAIFEKIESLKKDIEEIRLKLEQTRSIKEKVTNIENWKASYCPTATAVIATAQHSTAVHVLTTGTSGPYSIPSLWNKEMTPDYVSWLKTPEDIPSSLKELGLLKREVNKKETR